MQIRNTNNNNNNSLKQIQFFVKIQKKREQKSEPTVDEVVCILSGISVSDKASDLLKLYKRQYQSTQHATD